MTNWRIPIGHGFINIEVRKMIFQGEKLKFCIMVERKTEGEFGIVTDKSVLLEVRQSEKRPVRIPLVLQGDRYIGLLDTKKYVGDISVRVILENGKYIVVGNEDIKLKIRR